MFKSCIPSYLNLVDIDSRVGVISARQRELELEKDRVAQASKESIDRLRRFEAAERECKVRITFCVKCEW